MKNQTLFLSLILLLSFALSPVFVKAGGSPRDIITKLSRTIGHSTSQGNSPKSPELTPDLPFSFHKDLTSSSLFLEPIVLHSLFKHNQSFNFQSSGAQIFHETSTKDSVAV